MENLLYAILLIPGTLLITDGLLLFMYEPYSNWWDKSIFRSENKENEISNKHFYGLRSLVSGIVIFAVILNGWFHIFHIW